MSNWQGQAPRGFVRRWVVPGTVAGSWPGTTVFDLAEDRRHVMVRPAAVDRFAILVDAGAVDVLLRTLDDNAACAVPGRHATQGAWLLGLRPAEPAWTDRCAEAEPRSGPLVLYVQLPGDEIQIVYRDRHLDQLRDTLAHLHQLMAH